MSRLRFFSILPALPALTILMLAGPVVAGLYGTVLPAFGHLPSAGHYGPSLDPFRDLFNWPGFDQALIRSLTTGIMAAVLSLGVVTLILAGWSGTPLFRWIERLLSPLLAVPHAAAAFGLAFMIAPSGWVSRLFSPWLTGWERPPDLLILNDPLGLSLVAGLVMKEVPFLLLMSLAALGQVNAAQRMNVAQSLGYGRVRAFLWAVFPPIYTRIRLPMLVVLAWSISVVDVAVILGPSTPATLSVQILRWMSDPDISFRLRGAAAALVQLASVLGAIGLWIWAERLIAQIALGTVTIGQRASHTVLPRALGLSLITLIILLLFAGLASLVVWSFAGFWSFPDLLPNSLTLRSWSRHASNGTEVLGITALIALAAALIALILTIGCLEAEDRFNLSVSQRGMWLLYLPLLVPQTAFIPGVQTLMLSAGLKSGIIPVILAHLVFVLPYIRLSLQDSWRAWDTRQATVAAALGASPLRILWAIRLPMLLAPILTALAVGLSVSVGQYLPTLLIGGGRVSTLTTEAVALASGGDRRAIGVYSLLQLGAAMLPFAMALIIPALVWRNRKGLRHD